MLGIHGMIACCVAVLLAAPVVAATPELGCFSRSYGAGHLAANPAQQVQRVDLTISPVAVGQNDAPLGLSLRLKGKRQAYGTGGNCTARADGWQCRTDTDGEMPFLLQWRGQELVMTLKSRMKVTHFPAGDYPDDQLVGGAADSVFVLRQLARCPAR